MSSAPYQSPWMNDELRMFRATVRQFIQKEFVPHQARWREQQRPDVAAWTLAGRTGMLLPDLPEAYGGGGGTFAHAVVVLEELAHAGVHFGSGIQSVVAHYILAYGGEEQKCRWLPPMARGELVAAIAMSEPGAGSDLRGIQTTARREGEALRHQWLQDVYHQRRTRRPRLPGGEDGPARFRGEGHFSPHRGDAGPARIPGWQPARQSRDARPGHV